MRATTSLQFYSILLLLLTSFSVAFPWPRWLPERDALIVRQDSASSTPAAKASNTASANPSKTADAKSDSKSETESGAKASATDKDSSSSASGTDKGPITEAPKTTGSSSGNSTEKTSYGNENPAGAVVLQTPAVIQGSMFYKIGSNITFAWNFTNLLATPTALNVYASNTRASQYYTITANMTIGSGANNTNGVIWDTAKYTDSPSGITNPLFTDKYTLVIFDADSSVSATAQPGYLAVYNQYTFGMYTPQPYQDLADGYKCATCSGAMGDMERRVIGFVLGMGMVTVLSFTWFVTGSGVVW